MSARFPVEHILPELGFERVEAGSMEDWRLTIRGLEMGVVCGPNRFFTPSLNFAGSFNNSRTMQLLEFSIAAETASREEALALIGYYLRDIPADFRPSWLVEAMQLRAHLPWIKGKA